MRQADAPRLLLTFLAAAGIAVLGIALAALIDSYWAVTAAAVLLVALLGVVLREIDHELGQEE